MSVLRFMHDHLWTKERPELVLCARRIGREVHLAGRVLNDLLEFGQARIRALRLPKGDTYLKNIQDEIVALIRSTMYMLTLK